MFFAAIGMFGVFLFLTYYLEENLQWSAVKTGVAFLPLTLVLVVVAALGNTLLTRVSARILVPFGLLIAAAGMALLTNIGLTSDYAADVLPTLLLVGAGLGLVFAPSFTLGTLGVEPGDAGVGLGHGQRRAADRRVDRHLAAEHDRRRRHLRLHRLARSVHHQRGRQAAGRGELATRQLPRGVLGGGRDLRRAPRCCAPWSSAPVSPSRGTAPPSRWCTPDDGVRGGGRRRHGGCGRTPPATASGSSTPPRTCSPPAGSTRRSTTSPGTPGSTSPPPTGTSRTSTSWPASSSGSASTGPPRSARRRRRNPDPWAGLTEFLERSLELLASNRALVDVLTRTYHGGDHFDELLDRTSAPA